MQTRKRKKSLEALHAVAKGPIGRELTAEEEAEFRASRAPSYLVSKATPTLSRVKKGKVVYRTPGRVGGDCNEHPDTKASLKVERGLRTAIAKIKGPPIAAGVAARQAKARANDALIRDKLDEHAGKKSGAAAVVAKQTASSPQHVRRVAKKRT